VRHIPEDELHAYLDQALSRSQCIEIETHLSRCLHCRNARDSAAALRDRTTALLSRAMPQVAVPPPFATLTERAATTHRHAWRRRALWAASLAGALVGGWGLRAALDPHQKVPVMARAEIPAAGPTVSSDLPLEASLTREPANEPVASERVITPPPAPGWSDPTMRLATGGTPPTVARLVQPAASEEPEVTDALWQTVSLSRAEDASGGLVPTLPDLPVVEVRVRPAGPQERPLVMVAQRLPSGDLVRTFEGPVAAVAAVVAEQLRQPEIRSSEPARSLPDYVDTADGIERTSRVLVVVSRLPADSLAALAQSVVLR
jgi:hypothetical protein